MLRSILGPHFGKLLNSKARRQYPEKSLMLNITAPVSFHYSMRFEIQGLGPHSCPFFAYQMRKNGKEDRSCCVL